MDWRRSVEGGWRCSVAEMVRLFVLPPLLAFALVASSLLLFATYLSERSLQTTFVFGHEHAVGGAALGHVGDVACSPAPPPP